MSGPIPLPGGSLVRALVFAKWADGSDELLGEADRGTATAALLASVGRASARIDALATEDERFVGLSVEFEAFETVEARAVRILVEAGMDAYLQQIGGGASVAEVRSDAIANRFVWVTDSEGEQGGPFLVGAYSDPEGQEWIEFLSGACAEGELVERASRGLSTEIGGL